MQEQEIIDKVYTLFNARDIDGVLAYFHHEVDWPNGWEGGYVHGHAAIRDYWTRQWKEIDPIVTPIGLNELDNGLLSVDVKQVVKDLEGNLIADVVLKHIYQFEEGLIKRMSIED